MERYERVYEVGLLDDLHNYFPALLYQHDLFHSVQDVLRYVRQRTIRRFNLFDYGRRHYEANMVPPRQEDPVVIVRQVRQPLPQPQAQAQPLPLPQAQPSIFEDIIVHASSDIIDRASTHTTLLADMEDNCSVCQDRMREGEIVRKLTVCQHTFHRACVDNWLLTRSVFCPTCRHDIRSSSQTNDTLSRNLLAALLGTLPI
jgi:hypothetical protein